MVDTPKGVPTYKVLWSSPDEDEGTTVMARRLNFNLYKAPIVTGGGGDPYDPPGGNYYSNPLARSAPPPQQFYFWLGAEAEGFHART